MAYTATHFVATLGARTWPRPDPALAEGPLLEPGLDVQVLECDGAWAHITCSNGWQAWTDWSLLVPLPTPATAPLPPPPTSHSEPQPSAGEGATADGA